MRTVGGDKTSPGGDRSVGAGSTDEPLVSVASPSPKVTAPAGSPSNHSTKSGGSSQFQPTGKIPHKPSFVASAKKPGSSPRRKGWARHRVLATTNSKLKTATERVRGVSGIDASCEFTTPLSQCRDGYCLSHSRRLMKSGRLELKTEIYATHTSRPFS